MSKPYVEQKFDEINSQLEQVATVEVLRLSGESDSALINRLLTIGIKKILLDSKTYNLGELNLSDYTGVQISGTKKPTYNGTSLVDGTIINGYIHSNSNMKNCEFCYLGITNSETDGVVIHDGSSYNYFHDMVLLVNQHGILIESYGLENIDNIVENCIAYGGVHGFVSKSKGTKFINCISDGATTDGFVLCSDNIPLATKIGQCYLNVIDKCVARNTAIGYILYSRDYYSENNSNGISCSNISITNSTADTISAYGVCLGDDSVAPSGRTYNQVKNITLYGNTFINCTTGDILFAYCDGVTIDGNNINKFPILRNMDKAKNINFGRNNTGFSVADINYWTKLDVNITTPKVDSGRQYYKTENTATTLISNFLGNRKVGQVIYITINDDFTSIIRGANIALRKYKMTGKGSFAIFKLDPTGSYWEDVYSYSPMMNQFWATPSDTTIDWDYGNIADTYITANINNITFSTPKDKGLYYIKLRCSGAFTINSWDNRIKWISQISTTVSGKIITIEFLWDGTNFIQLLASTVNT